MQPTEAHRPSASNESEPSPPLRSRLETFVRELRRPERAQRLVTLTCLIGLLLIGLAIFRDFGLSWDERVSHRKGKAVLDFLADGDRDRLKILGDYGPVFNVALALIDKISGPRMLDYQLGHLFGYFLFLGGVCAMYGLCKRQFGAWGWGVLGAGFLAASPVVFSHAFVNPKDAPIMCLTLIAFYFLIRFLESRRIVWLVAAGVFSGLAIDVRINAIFIIGVTGLALFLDAFNSDGREDVVTRLFVPSAVYAGTTVVVVVAFWPLLWTDPIDNLLAAFQTMSHYPRRSAVTLYMGRQFPEPDLPWHYFPWWLAISTPIPYLALALVGLFSVPARRVRNALRERSDDRILLVYGAWLFVPSLYVLLTGAALYGGWRQMMFIYPPIVVFAVAGAVRVWRWLGTISRPRLQRAWLACLVVTLGWVGFRMAELHPYQSVYFNSLVGGADGAVGRYAGLNAWGTPYKDGLGYLLSSTNGRVRLWTCTQPGRDNRFLFSKEERARLRYVSRRKAAYALCSRRRHPRLRQYPTIYSVRRDGATLLYVKDLRPRSSRQATGE